MRQKKQKPAASTKAANTPIYRAIRRAATDEQPQPGDIGQAAVAAAALHQLNRYAEDVQQYLNSSKMRSLLNRIQADMELDPTPRTRMRVRRD